MMAENKKPNSSAKAQHPLPVKIFHSVNIIAVALMASSGLQIYNATPVFGGKGGWAIPGIFTLGGWLAGGRHWHFAFMWLFFLNLAFFIGYLVVSKRWKSRYASKADTDAILNDKTASKRKIYAFHRILYSAVLPVLILALLSGLAMYKPVQFDWLANSVGSWQNLRIIHFVTVPLVILFIVIHSALGMNIGGWRIYRSIFWR